MKIITIDKIKLFQIVHNDLVNTISKNNDKTVIFLSGGSVVELYPLLRKAIEEEKIDRKKICFAQVDERYRPEKIDNVNAETIEKTGLWSVCTKRSIPFHLISQELSFSQSFKAYNETVGNLFTLYPNRLAILGMGEDGHTAGLLPGYQKDWDVRQYAIGYKNEGKFPLRISITPFCIRLLNEGILLALGEKKKEVLRKLNSLQTDYLNIFPAQILGSIKSCKVFTDQNLVK